MPSPTARIRIVLPAVLAGAVLSGCQPARPGVFDAPALLSAKKAIVLPFTDAPGVQGKGSGQVVGGSVLTELFALGRYEIANLTPDGLREALAKTGYAADDCYDPIVAAAVGRQFNADIVVAGELTHYRTQQEDSSTAVLIVSGGGTKITQWVSMNLRIIRAEDAKTIYAGSGTASSAEGYSPAAQQASNKALALLKDLFQRGR
jgi:hypothetical protein